MADVFSSDIQTYIVPETVPGTVTTATGTTKYEVPVSVDQNILAVSATEIKSNTKRPNRAGNGVQRGMLSVAGSLDIRAMSTPVVDLLLASSLSGTFATSAPKIAKAGTTDATNYFTVIHKLASDQYKINAGCIAKGFTLDAKANDAVNLTFDVMGFNPSVAAADATSGLTVTAVAGTAYEFDGADVQNITVGGQSVAMSELSFQTTQDRTQRPVLGSTNGLALGVNGNRETTVTLKLYRQSLAMDTLLNSGTRYAFTFDVGVTGNGYRIACPSMDWSIPTDELSNGSAFVTIKGTAAYDSTIGTDLTILKL